jgi:rod shape-determining protein MreD
MNKIISNILFSVLLIFFQAMFLNNINFLNFINPYLYIFFIIYFPLKTNRSIFILIAFFTGLIIDFFSDTHGMHAAACLSIAYFRTYFLKIFFGMAYKHQVVKFKHLEFKQNFFYLITMIFTHHVILFSLEVFSLNHLDIIFKKTICSLIFSFILIIIFFEFFIKKSK